MKTWHVLLLLGGMFLILGRVSGASRPEEEAIRTEYPTKDWVVADFVVTDPRFGAEARPGFDNRKAFQKAIDAAYEAGGGVVYVPAGHYEFRSTAVGSKMVRVRSGEGERQQRYAYEYVLRLPSGVQLRGDWSDPDSSAEGVSGTILEVRVGAGSRNCDGRVESWWNDPQAGNVLRTSYTSVADRFLEMQPGTGVTNLSIWYPEQSLERIQPYPWTLFQTSGDCATVERVTLVNSYNGFYSAPSELHYLKDCRITALNKAVELHVCTDIGRIERFKIAPTYWAGSQLPGAPAQDALLDYMQKHVTGIEMHRSDWEYLSHLTITGCRIGLWIGREPGFDNAPNAQIYDLNVQACATGLYVEDVNPYGILVSNSSIGSLRDGKALHVSEEFDTSLQFNGTNFAGKIFSAGKSGVISFESCRFAEPEESDFSLVQNGGTVLLTQCSFAGDGRHVRLGTGAERLGSVNSGCNGHLDVSDNSRNARIEVDFDPGKRIDPIPMLRKTDVEKQPRPHSPRISRPRLSHVSGYNRELPMRDVSKPLQRALDDLAAQGGGTLYLPAGRYLLNRPIVVPSGVELRGSWDVPHHTMNGGTALFTDYTGGREGEAGIPLIRLEARAGIRGLNIAQLNLVRTGAAVENPKKTPFLIQGLGPEVYVINVTVSLGDKGIDLASYDTSRHYVDYFAGTLLRVGVQVGGGACNGVIRNLQFNPHYSQRMPRGGQGYPKVFARDFIQSHCRALTFSDVREQVIFNNFVFGSIYGIHFRRDALTGRCPARLEMIGHGSDGCTFALFVEDADRETKITGINSELVNTNIRHQKVRSYVLMGDDQAAAKVDPSSELRLYNSAFWGSPTTGVIVNGGQVRFSQANFHRCGNPGVNVRKGRVWMHTSNLAQPLRPAKHEVYVRLDSTGGEVVQFNNRFASGFGKAD